MKKEDKKIVLITGTSTGVGYWTAKKFLEEGHIVYGISRRTKLMQPLLKMGGKMITGDVRKDSDVRKLVQKIIKEQGRIDVLVNNAGYAQYGSLEDVTIEQAKAQLETNTFAYARMIKEVLPYMRKQGSGYIINVTSTAGRVAGPIITWYNASKYALEGLLDALRGEVQNQGIKVVLIEPGFIDTDLYRTAWQFLDKVNVTKPYQYNTAALKKKFKEWQVKGPKGDVIAKVIYKASKSKNPRTRYVAPLDGKFFMFLKKILSDKQLDKVGKKILGME